jgi:DNA-binding HxlR family transcriptional regulator
VVEPRQSIEPRVNAWVAVDYRLTAAGLALLPALKELMTWATSNLPA